MSNIDIVCLCDKQELISSAAEWYHSIWKIPLTAYIESMNDALTTINGVPRWYVALDSNRFVGGVGIIANDFHRRADLTPNVCALYVAPEYRKHGLAGRLLDTVCQDAAKHGHNDTYLLTDHTSFYERYGWDFLCIVEENGGDTARCYHKHTTETE